MSTMRLMGAGAFTAIAASLCCITPVLALIADSGGIASSFSWIEPARPYLIGITISVLGFAWYQKLKPISVDECGCAVEEKPKFIQSKTFLLIITIFAVLMMTFPSYVKVFFPKNEKLTAVIEKSNIQTVELSIKGMSCEACEEEVNHDVNKLPGILQSIVSYKNRNAIIKFDLSKTTIKDITNTVNATGYKVINQSIKN
jgi:mercuric ion transport protein